MLYAANDAQVALRVYRAALASDPDLAANARRATVKAGPDNPSCAPGTPRDQWPGDAPETAAGEDA
jgi:hypothetical protein